MGENKQKKMVSLDKKNKSIKITRIISGKALFVNLVGWQFILWINNVLVHVITIEIYYIHIMSLLFGFWCSALPWFMGIACGLYSFYSNRFKGSANASKVYKNGAICFPYAKLLNHWYTMKQVFLNSISPILT